MNTTETRITDWVATAGRAGWADSNISHYRIWQQFDGRNWFQRHEWKRHDGSIHLEDWINGVRSWGQNMTVVTDEVAA